VSSLDSELAFLLERGNAAVRSDDTVADLVRAADERRDVDGLEPRWEAGHLVVRVVTDKAEPLAHRRVRVVVSRAGRGELLSTLHARGLFSAAKLGGFVTERFYWPGMDRDVQALIDGCDECIKAAHVNRTSNNFGDSEAGSGVDERVFAAREGYQADTWQVPELGVRVVALVCLFTGFTLLMQVEDGSAAESARVAEGAFSVLGLPRFVKTDGGPEFQGAFGERLEALGVRLARGSPYNSDAQARAERRIGEANHILRRLIMHARPAGAPDVAALLVAAQTAINAVVLPKVVRERVGGAMTRSGAFFGSEPRFEVPEWATAADEEDAPIGVGAPGTLPGDGHAQVARVRLALAAAYEAGCRNGDFVPVALSAAQRETQRERAVEASYRARAAAYDPAIRPVVGDLVWRRQVAPGAKESGKIGSHVFAFSGPFEITAVSGESVVAEGEAPAPLKAQLRHVYHVTADGEPVAIEHEAFVRDLVLLGDEKSLYGTASIAERNGVFRSNLAGVEKARFDARLAKVAAPVAGAKRQRGASRAEAADSSVAQADEGCFVKITKFDEAKQLVRGMCKKPGVSHLVTCRRSVDSLSAADLRCWASFGAKRRRRFEGRSVRKWGFH
jgi:hypothetical protein